MFVLQVRQILFYFWSKQNNSPISCCSNIVSQKADIIIIATSVPNSKRLCIYCSNFKYFPPCRFCHMSLPTQTTPKFRETFVVDFHFWFPCGDPLEDLHHCYSMKWHPGGREGVLGDQGISEILLIRFYFWYFSQIQRSKAPDN